MERVDLVDAFSVVEARLRCTIVSVYLTKHTLITYTSKQSVRHNSSDVLFDAGKWLKIHTWHADAVESANLVEAGGVILAGV